MTSNLEELGPNAGLVDEMYRLYRDNPQAVSAGWREFFEDYVPHAESAPAPAPAARSTPAPTTPAAATPAPAPAAPSAPSGAGAPVVLEGESPAPLRGAAA